MTTPMTEMNPAEYRHDYFLTAGETDATGHMPMWLLVSRVIEVATEHANILGVGYDELIRHGIGWVITRLTIEMDRYPGINERYSLVTWIEGYNRLYSDRCMAVLDGDGNEIGRIRSMWVAIDFATRSAADLTMLPTDMFVLSSRRSPVTHSGKQRPLGEDARSVSYTFGYSDLDFNRHVNTVQYVRLVLNRLPLDIYDHCEIKRYEMQFHNECHYGETAAIRWAHPGDDRYLFEIVDPQGRRAVTTGLTLASRKQ